jgi:uncharacterized protein
LQPYQPFFRNGDLSTIAANFWPRDLDHTRFPSEPVFFQTEPQVQVMAMRHRAPTPARGTIVGLHGLEGSHDSGYLHSLAHAGLSGGFEVYRLNMRTCGGTEHLAPTLYHAGLTSDLRALLPRIAPPVFLVGYSLGGNVVLKLLGELGAEARRLGVVGGVSISTPLDLMACCLRMQEPRNFVYSNKFIKSLRARYLRRAAAYPEVFPTAGLEEVKSVLEFDDKFTSKAFGFGNAANYYKTQSSQAFLQGIEIPTLILHSQDDPLIPTSVYHKAGIERNPRLSLELTRHGGHVGYLSRSKPRFWAEYRALHFIEGTLATL